MSWDVAILSVARKGLAGTALAVLLSHAGCVSPIAVHRAVLEYDRTVSQTDTELLLLNIARSRHHRPLHFTAVSNVAATFDFRTTTGVTGEVFEGVFAGAVEGFTKNFYSFNLGASVAEVPTVNIIPVQGKEFTKRVLTPMDEAEFEFLFHRGADPAMLLRLLARAIIFEHDDTEVPTVFPNEPRQADGYREFRRHVLHLSSLNLQHELHMGPLVYEERWPLPVTHTLTAQALDKGYQWDHPENGQEPVLTRRITGRFVITNYDPARLSNDERRRLNEEAMRYPRDQVFVDIRPEHPGGDYPLHGRIQLRSFEAVLAFLARGIAEEPEFDVEKDPRTGPIPANPPRTIEVAETTAAPPDAAFAVEFEGRWYSIRRNAEDGENVRAWNLDAFRVLYQSFQMTVTDVARVPTFPITISKPSE